MKNHLEFVAIIPARKGSKGIKNKNITKIKKTKMIEYSFLAATKCKHIKKIFLTTNDEKIIHLSKKYEQIEVFKRKERLATSSALLGDVIDDTLKKIIRKFPEAKNFVLLQPTSPQRSFRDIDDAISFFKNNKKRNLISVSEPINSPYEMIFLNKKKNSLLINRRKQLNRQSYKKSYYINGSIFIGSINKFLKDKKFLNKNSIFYRMGKMHSIDINDNFDKKLVESFF